MPRVHKNDVAMRGTDWDRAAFLRWRRLKPTLLDAKDVSLPGDAVAQLFEGVIGAEMWYLFSFEQRPASQLAVPLGGTQ